LAMSLPSHAAGAAHAPETRPPPDAAQADARKTHGAAQFAGLAAGVRRRAVAKASELGRMKSHLATRYLAADVRHSFKDGNDDVDCVDKHKQPALLRPGMAGHVFEKPPLLPGIAHLPPTAPHPAPARAAGNALNIFLAKGEKDRAGKEKFCPPGSVPIVR